MDKNFADLCYACRTGDTDNVDRIVSTGVNLNGVDQFDNSPLFLASLCGHEEIVKLLLARGAVCDRDRYEGARCIYGALTDSIRDILLRYDISKAVDVNQPFTTHISSLLKGNFLLDTHDLCYRSCNKTGLKESLQLHKFILASRSAKFKQDMTNRWRGRHIIDIPEGTSMDELSIIIKFIYLIPVVHEISSKQYVSLIKNSRKWGMNMLAEFLDKQLHTPDPYEKSALMVAFQYKFTELAREQFCNFVNNDILRNTVDLNYDEELTQGQIQHLKRSSVFPDVLLVVENPTLQRLVIPCHMAILSRAHYFKLMFGVPLVENSIYKKQKVCDNQIDLVAMPIVPFPSCDFDVAIIIMRYLYYDGSDIPWEYAIDVLLIADMLMEDRLKAMAAVVVTQSRELLEHYSIFAILYVAWETRIERLEHFVAKVIAHDLKKYSKDPDLKEAIRQSSLRISVREETDTIELIDDIRFYLLEKYSFEPEDIDLLSSEEDIGLLKSSGILEYQQDVTVIEDLLNALILQA